MPRTWLLVFATIQAVAAQTPLLVSQSGHSGAIRQLAGTKDRRLLVSAGDDGSLRVWNLQARLLQQTIYAHSGAARELSLDPREELIATAGEDRSVRVWKLNDGAPVWEKRFEGIGPFSIAWSPDGNALAVAGDAVYTFSRDGKETANATPDSPTMGVAWLPDGAGVVVSDLNERLRRWKPGTPSFDDVYDRPPNRSGWARVAAAGSVVAHFGNGAARVLPATGGAANALVSGDTNRSVFALDALGKQVAAAGSIGKIEVYPAGGGTPASIPFPRSIVTALAFSADSRTIFVGDFDGNISVVPIATGKPEIQFTADTTQLLSIGFRTDGRLEMMQTDGNALIVTSPSPDGGRTRLSSGYLTPLAAQHLAGTVVAASSPLRVSLFDLKTRRLVREIFDESADGWPLACDGKDQCAWQRRKDGANLVALIQGRELPIGSDETLGLAFVGNYLAAATNQGTVRLWETATGIELPPLKMPSPPNSAGIVIAIDPALSNLLRHKLFVPLPGAASALVSDGERWLAASNSAGIKVCDVSATPFRCYDRTLASPASALALSGDSVLWTDVARKLHRWNFQTTTAPETLGSLSELARALSVRPDGGMAAMTLQGGAFELWDLNRRAILATVQTAGSGWLAATPEGLFDASEGGWRSAAWRFNDKAAALAPVEVFFQDFYHPDLIADLLRGEDPHPAKSLAQIDRTLPVVHITNQARTPSSIRVRITASESAVDLRVMLNGALVRRVDGELRGAVDLTLPLLPGTNEVRAYAFNRAGVKSLDDVLALPLEGFGYMRTTPTLHVLAIGIDQYRDPAFNLRFAKADADLLASALDRPPEDLQSTSLKLNELFNRGMFDGPRQGEELPARVVVTKLENEQATRAGILAALGQLAKDTKPEDAVLIFYAGHGLASGAHYYLLPHDTAWKGTADTIGASGISDTDLEHALEGINPKYFAVVLDSCQSGKVLEGERPRGPLNGSGLARLVYEKGIFLLAASQSYQAALEVNSCGHGLLSCALIQEGLLEGKADFDAADGRIDLAEWFRYAENRVPDLSVAIGAQRGVNGSGTRSNQAPAQKPAFVTRATAATDKLIVRVP